MKRLRIPATLGVAVLGTTLAIAGSCRDDGPSRDAQVVAKDAATHDTLPCQAFCIPDGTDAGVCPSPQVCVDGQGNCPPGCEPEPMG